MENNENANSEMTQVVDAEPTAVDAEPTDGEYNEYLGRAPQPPKQPQQRAFRQPSATEVYIKMGVLCVAVIALAVLFFSAGIKYEWREEEREIYFGCVVGGNITIEVDTIESVRLLDENHNGFRSEGLGTPFIKAGTFRNDAYGKYALFIYTKTHEYVEITYADGNVCVTNRETLQETEQLYEDICEYAGISN